MKSGFLKYLTTAFNARPLGMPIPPNWIGIGAFTLLGLLNPGFWILGAGVELGYLFLLSTNGRFQRLVDARHAGDQHKESAQRLGAAVGRLSEPDQARYRSLEHRCRTLMADQRTDEYPETLNAHAEGLGRLLWVYLQLLVTRQSLVKIVQEAAEGARRHTAVQHRLAAVQERLARDGENLDAELRRSLVSQREVLEQRIKSQREAAGKLDYVDSELIRVEEQVQLIREQSLLAAQPGAVSERIDAIAATLGSTTQWLRDQTELFGSPDDGLDDPPPIVVVPPGIRERE